MKERLKQLRKDKGLTQQEFADKLNIQRATYAKYEVGRNEPIDAVIALICDRFGVNEQWLRTGEGDMYVEINRDDEMYRLVDELLADDSQEMKKRLATAILRLTPEQMEIGLNWIKNTFGLVDAPDRTDQEAKKIIDQKVDNYRRELEAEFSSKESQKASQTGNAGTESHKAI